MPDINWKSILEEAIGDFTLAVLPPTLKLPALPHAVTQFTEKSQDPDVGVKDLAAIIETDTGLTVELLKFVNSAFMGVRNKARCVQQSLSLLGHRQSKSFVIQTGMQAAVRARQSKLINQNGFWNASLQKAIFAREVAGLLKTDGDLAFSGSLLQDYLLPVVTNDLFDDYLKFVENREDYPDCITVFEHKTFGFNHALAAACLAKRWFLPDDLVCCILFHHMGLKILAHPELGRSAVAAVALSAMLPDQLRQNLTGLDQLQKLQEKWNAFNLEQLAETVDRKHEEMGLGVRNDFPLSRRTRPADEGEVTFNDGTLNNTPAAITA